MLTLLLSLAVSAQAATCDITSILRAAKPEKKCIDAYLAKIDNAEDRAEMKFRLKEWKPIPNLQVLSDGGMLEAYDGDQIFLRAVMMQYQKPLIIWMDGKILHENSDNPSFARRLQNAMKTQKKTSAALDLVLPSAYAQEPEVQQTVLMAYALGSPGGWGPAESAIRRDDFGKFLPGDNFLTRNWPRARPMRCTADNLVESTDYALDSTSDVNTRLHITPQSPTEFLIKGLTANTTHRIRLTSFVSTYQDRHPMRHLSPRSAGAGMVIETCADPTCAKVLKTETLDDWNLLLRRTPDQEARRKKGGVNEETMAAMNRDFRMGLSERLFGLSVLGDCCRTDLCRAELQKRWNIQLQPAGTSPTTAQ